MPSRCPIPRRRRSPPRSPSRRVQRRRLRSTPCSSSASTASSSPRRARSTPPSRSTPLSRPAVFCQKPLGRDGIEVRAVLAAARAADRLLGVDLSYRFTAGMVAIRDLVQRGELGAIFAVDLVFHNAYGPDKPWFYDRAELGGGCVIDLGVHLVDLALWVLGGDRARAISASLLEQRPTAAARRGRGLRRCPVRGRRCYRPADVLVEPACRARGRDRRGILWPRRRRGAAQR